jgi:hypothetical protein
MTKLVKYNGQSLRITFNKIVLSGDSLSVCKNGYSIHNKGVVKFIINNKEYLINWESKKNETWSINNEFEGFKCGDSDKKMIEFIISKYGI